MMSNKPTKTKKGSRVKLSHSTTRQFRLRYALVIGLTALLFYVSYWLLISSLDKQGHFVEQVNTIGKQNTLSQEIAKFTLSLQACKNEKKCQADVEILRETVDKFIVNQKKLIENNKRLKQEGVLNEQADSLIQLNAQYSHKHIVKASQALIQLKLESMQKPLPNPRLISLNIDNILFREQMLNHNLEILAGLYDEEAQAYIQKIKVYQSIVLGLAFLILGLEAFLFLPKIAGKIQLAIQELEHEHKVSQVKNQKILETNRELHRVKEKERADALALQESHEDLLRIKEELTQSNRQLIEKNKRLEKTDALIKANQELEAARFFDQALNRMQELMRWDQNENMFHWAEQLLNELIPYVGGHQGILYVWDEDEKKLSLNASYALEKSLEYERMEIELGDQFVGQAAKSRQPILLNNLNGQALSYASNTAIEELKPRALYILPLIYNDQLAGVLEISSMQAFENRYLELLNRLSPGIAANLNSLLDQKRINQLFADSQMAQKKLQRSVIKIRDNEERFRKLSELTQEGLVFLNGNEIKDINSVILRLLGYDTPIELLNRPYIDLIAPRNRSEIEEKKILEDGHSHETQGLKKNGETLPIEIQAREVNYGGEINTLLSIRDITEKKETEKELEEANRIAQLVTELEKKNKDITSSIAYAQRIQEAILPADKLIGKGFLQHFVMYQPKDIVSGDFYWFAEKNEHALIAAVDCTGHGVPGAFMSIIGYSNLNKIVLEQGITQPDVILNKLDAEVTEVLKQKEENSQSRDGMDLALCSLNIYEKTLQFAGAYRPLILFRDGEMFEFKGNSYPIGGNFKYKKKKHFEAHEIKLEAGDTLYIYSDGYPDQFGGPDNRKYNSKKFKKLLGSIQDQDLNQQKKTLEKEFYSWKGDYKQMDDILVIGLRF